MRQNYLKFLLVALLAFVGTTSLQAYNTAAKNSDGMTIYYNYINNKTELEVTSSENEYSKNECCYSGNVVIPETVTIGNQAIKVTAIGSGAFKNCSGLKEVNIPNSVKI